MKSKFFKINHKKVILIALLSSSIGLPSFDLDIEASVAEDLIIYSGGGGGGSHNGASFWGINGSDGSSLIINGDEAEIFGTIEDTDNPLKYQLSGYSGNYNVLSHYSPFSQNLIQLSALHSLSAGGGVDGFNGTNIPSGLALSRSLLNYSTLIDIEEDVNNLRIVSGDGGQLGNPEFIRQYLEDIYNSVPSYVYENTVQSIWNVSPHDILLPANDGVTLNQTLGTINLYNSAFIKSGSFGADIPTKEIALPHLTLGTKNFVATHRAKGGNIFLDIDTLQLMNNNRLDIVKDSADIDVEIQNMLMTSNGVVILDNMTNVGASRFMVRNFDFIGGTFSYDILLNDTVNLSGSTLNVLSRDLDNDDVYDLLKSEDYFSGMINLNDSTGEVVEYRLISNTETIVLDRNTTSINLDNYSNVHTIQAIFGYRADFVSNGGSSVLPQTGILLNEQVLEPINPTKDGYIFDGWFSDESLIERYIFSDPVVSDVTLYAKWNSIPRNYNLYFESNGGTPVPHQVIPEGNRGSKPTDPNRKQDKFLGWFTDQTYSQLYNFDTVLSNDLTVYAKWESLVTPNPDSSDPDSTIPNPVVPTPIVPSPEVNIPLGPNIPKDENETMLPATGVSSINNFLGISFVFSGFVLVVINRKKRQS